MKTFSKVMAIILVVLTVIMIPVNVVIRMFDNTISLMIPGNRFWELEGEDPDCIETIASGKIKIKMDLAIPKYTEE